MTPNTNTVYSAADAYSPQLSSSAAAAPLQSGQHQSSGVASQDDPYSADNDSSEDWNVYDDFNNKRPISIAMMNQSPSYRSVQNLGDEVLEGDPESSRKQQHRQTLIPSGAFGFDARGGHPNMMTPDEQQKRYSYADSTEHLHRDGRDTAGMELITIPALGAEFTKEEVKAMKKPYKRKRKARTVGWNARKWIKTDDRYCGCLSPIAAVFAIFISLGSLGLLLYFVIPRVPVIAVQTVTPLVAVPDGASMVTHHSPTNFSMDMKINLRADNSAGWIPTYINKMEMKVYDILTSKLVGEGTAEDLLFPGRKRTPFQFPVSLGYASLNVTGDQTWLHWVNACGPKYANTARQSLSLQFSITMHIRGLFGTYGTSASLSDLQCPFTLQANQT